MTSSAKHCALIVGHSLERPGAQNTTRDISEYSFNSRLAQRIKRLCVTATGVRVSIVQRTSYRKLPAQINALNPDFSLSLHCNAFDGRTSGTQTLYFHTSLESRALAEALQCALVNCLHLRDRGVVSVTENDRGGYLLKSTEAPCVIAEPFFLDNDLDLDRALERFESLARAYACLIQDSSGLWFW